MRGSITRLVFMAGILLVTMVLYSFDEEQKNVIQGHTLTEDYYMDEIVDENKNDEHVNRIETAELERDAEILAALAGLTETDLTEDKKQYIKEEALETDKAEKDKAEPDNYVTEPLEIKRVIHSSDLFHPHDDFDDVLDLMSMFALHSAGEIDLRAVILDQKDKQAGRPGSVLVDKLNNLTGYNIPSGVGPQALLTALKNSPGPVIITVVGSVTDLWEAYKTDPILCEKKIEAVWLFAGDAQQDPTRNHTYGKDYHPSGLEYNVALNPPAFTEIIRSDLPIVWIPCYDGGLVESPMDGLDKLHGSYHMNQYEKLFSKSNQEVIKFFLEALSSERLEGGLYDWDEIKGHHKSLFGVGIFRAIPRPALDYPFDFVNVSITANDDGTISIGEGKNIKLFKRTDRANYYDRMSVITSKLLSYL
ncbi:hypothetical protein [Candidatus Contubernalis alkaliaceticus]|uniref:hypothetical protein n=1 Tax=Candidatus Contubernalis alkaliaceticus TaxID=338645 RepID=UPI001F4C35BC|nr:hypothetical protein [Candidatus Contubernalis alkalaceticus]UNC91547.1 hypothetical protein HUE98_05255 [Candidatus Contubernalis alkalaceticus]